ncbi:MAG: response regulator [Bacteroidales bacterium]|nr:response regulator [Bacteroidales bacterium]
MEESYKEPILYVDDEVENLQGFEFLLHRDFDVYVAASAREGLEILQKQSIKVVLTDQRMPEMSGIEFLEKAMTISPETIRIVVTAYSDSDTILQAINQGKAYHFITKPWNNNELRNIIRRALETYNLRKDKLQLISHLQNLNAELLKAKERAEESDKLKTSFLANMSHEIRTPLNAIVGFSNLLIDDNLKNPELKKEFVKIIESSASDLLNIIEDILDTAQIESGIVSIRENQVDINQLMVELLIMYQNHPQVKEKQLQIEYIYPAASDKFQVYIDRLRLKQILTNLLSNAVKFTERGKIEFGYRQLEYAQNVLQFFVRDTGIGIPSDKFDFIFERFRKLETDSETLYRGNGLGLYISRKLAQFMGGDISLESEVGKGSTFYLTIPYSVKQRESLGENYSSYYAHLSWPEKTILIVEDETSNYKYLEALLNNRANLIWAKNGIEAVQICSEKKIDLILMDIKLPKLDGFQATRKIKEMNASIPIIAVTAYAMEADKNESIQAGCNNYISKPFKMEELFSLINSYIG